MQASICQFLRAEFMSFNHGDCFLPNSVLPVEQEVFRKQIFKLLLAKRVPASDREPASFGRGSTAGPSGEINTSSHIGFSSYLEPLTSGGDLRVYF